MNILEKIVDVEEYFNRMKQHKNVILYGAGSKARQTLKLLKEKNVEPVCVCDGNEKLWGSLFLNRYPVCSYDQVKEKYEDYCFILSVASGNAVAIEAELKRRDNKAEIFHACNPFKVDEQFLNYDEIRKNEAAYSEIYDSFEDECSKKIYVEFLNSKLTGNQLNLCHITEGTTFFDPEIVKFKPNMVYVDVGAYTGDTVCRFLEYSGGNYGKIIAFEADEGNYDALCRFAKYGRLPNIELCNQALWSERKEMSFFTNDGNTEVNYDSPNLFHSIEQTADAKTLHELEEKGIQLIERKLEADSLDHFFETGKELPSVIKINALAADYPILCGAGDIFRKAKPTVIMEYGVRPAYLLEEMQFLRNLDVDYKFYLRQKNIFGDSKTVIYAV